MVWRNRNVNDIADQVVTGDTLHGCYCPQRESGTDLGLPKGLTFVGGLYPNCKRPIDCTGWDTVMSAQYRYEMVDAVPVYIDDVLIGEEPAYENAVWLAPNWEAIK